MFPGCLHSGMRHFAEEFPMTVPKERNCTKRSCYTIGKPVRKRGMEHPRINPARLTISVIQDRITEASIKRSSPWGVSAPNVPQKSRPIFAP